MNNSYNRNTQVFSYDKIETDYLSGQDPLLGQAMERIGHLDNPVMPDLFTAIVFNIVGQQISFKAAETVWQRIISAFASNNNSINLLPADMLSITADELQSMGISWRKVSYIRRIAEQFVEDTINPSILSGLSDDDIRHELIKLPGIGDWTVDMLLIFSFQRPNIISWHDLAIKRGLMRLHNLEELTLVQYKSYRRLYSPYGTIASFYLWEIAHERLDL